MTGSAGGEPGALTKPIDLIAMKDGFKPQLIQLSKTKKAIEQREVDELKRLAGIAGAVPIIAYKNSGRFVFENLLSPLKPGEVFSGGE